jgi:catechol 2,3-dioxygenase-like lactoylglutathione lyase family enzyme
MEDARRSRSQRRDLAPLVLLVAAWLCGCRPAPTVVSARDGGVGAPASAPAVDRSDTLLGGERGLDHVGVAVKDLDLATRTYRDYLGFSNPTEGKLPNGIRNVNYYFADATYLETLVHYDRSKATWLANFTDKHSGALFLVLSVYSVESTTAFLRRRGIEVTRPVPGTIQTAGDSAMPEEKWKTFFLKKPLLAGDPLYFIAYPRRDRDAYLEKLLDRRARRILRHDNTALGIKAVWIAVEDLPQATKECGAIGLEAGRRFADARLEAAGQEVHAGAGAIWLLSPAGKTSPVAAFLKERGGPGIMGLTLEAGSVGAAARLIGDRTGRVFPTYAGALGTSILVPPELTHGVWLEFAESPRRGRP